MQVHMRVKIVDCLFESSQLSTGQKVAKGDGRIRHVGGRMADRIHRLHQDVEEEVFCFLIYFLKMTFIHFLELVIAPPSVLCISFHFKRFDKCPYAIVFRWIYSKTNRQFLPSFGTTVFLFIVLGVQQVILLFFLAQFESIPWFRFAHVGRLFQTGPKRLRIVCFEYWHI